MKMRKARRHFDENPANAQIGEPLYATGFENTSPPFPALLLSSSMP
jgi:hypothetical protein